MLKETRVRVNETQILRFSDFLVHQNIQKMSLKDKVVGG